MLIPTDYSFNSQSINRIHTIGAYLQDDTDIANKVNLIKNILQQRVEACRRKRDTGRHEGARLIFDIVTTRSVTAADT